MTWSVLAVLEAHVLKRQCNTGNNKTGQLKMKPGRNDPCPCGSKEKYKRCCMDKVSKQNAEIADDFGQVIAMNPNLTLDELNVVAEHRMNQRNNRPIADFCGLSPTQMANWLYAPLKELAWITINTPDDLSVSPVMRYLTLILDEAMHNEGSFKATSKGNLPTRLVKQASDLYPKFAVAETEPFPRFSDYRGSNEDRFDALHYTRILAEIAGIIYRRSGRYHVKKDAQKQYRTHGVHAFFLPMLEAATSEYNWCYLDAWEYDVDLRTVWVFMLWRLQSHGLAEQLTDEVATAFPHLLPQSLPREYVSPDKLLGMMIRLRFIRLLK